MVFTLSPGMVSIRCEVGGDLKFSRDWLSDCSGLDS